MMRLITNLCCFFGLTLALSCQKPPALAPDKIENLVLAGIVTSGSGLFSDLENYQFTTHFDVNNNFQSKTKSGSIESKGTYIYKKSDSNVGTLILRPRSAIPSDSLRITLKFTGKNTGVYEGHLLSGGSGEQTGLFDLK
jgi:hypothetical protein